MSMLLRLNPRRLLSEEKQGWIEVILYRDMLMLMMIEGGQCIFIDCFLECLIDCASYIILIEIVIDVHTHKYTTYMGRIEMVYME